MRLLGIILSICLSFVVATQVAATPVDTYQFKSDTNQKRALELAHGLRCPQCQNQNLIDSSSPVARDLRLEVYSMVDEGKSDDEIINFMTSRYGEFVLYKPKLESKTYILWLGPFALLALGLFIGLVFVRKQRNGASVEAELSADDQKQLDELLKRSKE
ncbi:heme lyase NrfEFG subunit NrfF [Shewanella intestini]|uniref:Formate-dependent nitrite reductase complex subunit n=1 Tax=Shewanella intestini TaxID=2017544 RepID=A0ABS5I3V9_9GAMM|nr:MULTISPECIES: heme lyase NrfEFG subunit NrfF [Shewanella]MBR9728713.1 heme lyase NrfEFG subunit NrfF [Shewanella intestini]MRG37636.1 heme lyase NrfEFG subunit NrfF [Shewanella sp. XMDDZSB0408]